MILFNPICFRLQTVSIFLLLLLNCNLYGQSTDSLTVYFDGEWDQCDSTQAVYYRKCIWKDNRLAAVDYYKSTRTPQMIGYFSDQAGKVQTDTVIYFTRKGNLDKAGRYANDKKDGFWMSWFESGTKDSEGHYVEDKQDGKWLYYHPNGVIASLEIYGGDSLVKMKCWDDKGTALSVCYEHQSPEFPGGEENMMGFISKNIEYPEYWKQRAVEGKVLVQFVVDTTGALTDFEIIYSTEKSFGTEALRVLKLMPNWTMYRDHNRMIPVEFRLPLVFKLR